MHRRKCETSTAEVTLLSLPRASSQPPLLRENNATGSAIPKIGVEGISAARPCTALHPAPAGSGGAGSPLDQAGRVGNAESLLLCPFGSFSFCLHDTVSWESRRAPPAAAAPQGRHRAIRSTTLFLSWLCIVVINTRSIC